MVTHASFVVLRVSRIDDIVNNPLSFLPTPEYCDQKVEFGSYGVHVKQENSSDIIFNDSTEMNSECESTEQNYVIKDYKLQEKDGDDDLLPSPEVGRGRGRGRERERERER